MSGKTLKEIAFLISTKPADLIDKLAKAGVNVTEDSVLTDQQKKLLLSLSKDSGSQQKIQVKKKSTSDLKPAGSSNRLTIKIKKKKPTESQANIAKQGLVDTVSKINAEDNDLKKTKVNVAKEQDKKAVDSPSEVKPAEKTSQKKTNNFSKKDAAPKVKEHTKDKWYESKEEQSFNKKNRKLVQYWIFLIHI